MTPCKQNNKKPVPGVLHSGDRFFYGFLITVGRDSYLAARACITISPTPLSTAVGR